MSCSEMKITSSNVFFNYFRLFSLRFPLITATIIEFSGFGYGLLIPSWLTIMNSYFDKKHNLMMGVTQTTISVGTIVSPPVVAYLMEGLGFKKTLMVLGGLSLLNFPAVATFRPVRRCLEQQLPVALENIDTNSVASSRHSEGDLLRRISSENGEDIHNRILIQSKKPTSHIFKHWIFFHQC
nr:uncharacterized protein LOC111511264 [Leptinotarsa decemlineata]